MITNPAVEPPSPSPILDKSEQPYSHSDPFVTTPNVFEMHSQQTEQKPVSQTHEMDPPSPRPEGQALSITPTEDSPQDSGTYQGGGGYYGDSYNNYQQQGYPGNGYPQQGSQAWLQHQQNHHGTNVEYYHQGHHQAGQGYPHSYYNHPQHPTTYPTSDPYYQQQQMHQYYQHPHGHHHVHPHQTNSVASSGGGGGSNNCTPSPHAGSDDSSGDAVNESKPSPHYFQQQYPHGYPGGPFDIYGHPSHTNINEANCPPAAGGTMVHNTNSGYVKPELGSQPISTSVLKRPRSSLLPAPKRSKKSSRHRDPNEPQKPVSAYALFFRDTQAQIKSRSPAATFGEVSKMVAALWDQLDPDNKANYKRRTETAKKEYLKRLAAYRASLISKGDPLGTSMAPYNIGGGSSGFAYPTPRSAVVAHLPGNVVVNHNIGEHDGIDQPSKMGVPVNHDSSIRNDRGMVSPKENSAVGDLSTSHASAPLNGRQFSPINHQLPQHTSMKPIVPGGPQQSQPNTYGAHHHIGSQISTGSTMSTPQSSQPLPMGGSSFHTTDLHQSTQSNQLGATHLSRGNYQQPGRVN